MARTWALTAQALLVSAIAESLSLNREVIMRFAASLSLLLMSLPALAQSLHPAKITHLAGEADAVAIADLDGDGTNEVLVYAGYASTPEHTGEFHVLRPSIANGFLETVTARDLTTLYTYRPSLGVARGPGGQRVAVAGNNSELHAVTFDGNDLQVRTLVTTRMNEYLTTVDLDGDGVDEVFTQSWGGGGALYAFAPDGSLVLRTLVSTQAAGYNDIGSADLTGDGLADVAVMSGQLYSSPNLTVLPSNGVGGFNAPSTYRVAPSENTNGLGVGDITGDGRADVLLSRGSNSPTWLWQYHQTAAGELVPVASVPTYDIPSDVAITDLDGDGSNEALVLHHAWGRLSIYRSDEQGLIPMPEAIALPYGYYDAHALAVDDVTGDGCKDVVVGAGSGGVQLLQGAECVPPHQDLAVSLRTSASEAQIIIDAIGGTTAAENVVSDITFAISRHDLRITPPIGCVAVGALAYRCTAAQLAAGDSQTWSFGMRGKRNAIATVTASVSSSTLDLEPSNNQATATQRL